MNLTEKEIYEFILSIAGKPKLKINREYNNWEGVDLWNDILYCMLLKNKQKHNQI